MVTSSTDLSARGDTVLEGKNISKKYNQNSSSKETVHALQDVNFSIADNEFVVIVGPSGCGKTTLLHICAGLVDCTSGEVQYRGETVRKPGTERAVVFQHFNLFPWRTIIENVGFGLEVAGQSINEYRDRAMEYIDLVGLSGFEDNYPSELSGGMQQRVGLARALAVDPDVLLMDEPFGALDAQTRELMQNELLEIWEQDKKSIMFITHDIDEAIMLADRVLVMGSEPGTVKRDLTIPFERPRYDRNLEAEDKFAELKEEIWDVLQRDMDAKGE